MSKKLMNTIRCASRDISEAVLAMEDAQFVADSAWRRLGDAQYFHGFVKDEDAIASWEHVLDEACYFENIQAEVSQEMQTNMLYLETAWVKYLTQA